MFKNFANSIRATIAGMSTTVKSSSGDDGLVGCTVQTGLARRKASGKLKMRGLGTG